MHTRRSVFSQLMDSLPTEEFDGSIDRHRGNRRMLGFSCKDQFLCFAVEHLRSRECLRDIETCLQALEPNLYRARFRGKVARSTLVDAIRAYDWRTYAGLAQCGSAVCADSHPDTTLGVELKQTVYALDSITIELCLSVLSLVPADVY
jgi:Domain of unknown function (DUF4372)